MPFSKKVLTAALPAMLIVSAALATPAFAAEKALTAIKADAAPTLDGVAGDAAWQAAAPVQLSFIEGANFTDGKTTGSMKAVYVGDMLYVLLQYKDPTLSQRRSPYVKQADGTWLKLKDPDDKGGDNNKVYEDKFALIWPIGNSIADFDKEGCMTACHDDEPPKPYGNKYTETAGETGDMWHMKNVRTGSVGQTDDQWLDHTRYDPEKAKEAGRKADAKTGGGYNDIKLVDGKPEFMNKDGKAANKGGTYWLKESDKAPFDDSKFQAGDEVASILVAPIQGDRGDIATAMAWTDGVWTVEMSRKLVTGSTTDVQFDDLTAAYPFGISVFDNAQVRHAYVKTPLSLVFKQ